MKEVGLVALHSPKNINITELESHGVRTSLLPWKAEQQYCANAVSLFPCIVQFRMVCMPLCAPSHLRSFPNIAFEMVPMFD